MIKQTQLLSADVDNNGEVDVNDILILTKLVLSVIEKFPSNSSYKFVPTGRLSNFKFGNRPPYAWNLSASGTDYNFKAIKISNVN